MQSFERWADAAAEQREERAAAEARQAARDKEVASLSKFERIRRALFSRGYRICTLVSRCGMIFYLRRVFKKWLFCTRLRRAFLARSSLQRLQFFAFWRQSIPELQRQKQHDGKALAKKIVQSKCWR
jgi:hypothetical protein